MIDLSQFRKEIISNAIRQIVRDNEIEIVRAFNQHIQNGLVVITTKDGLVTSVKWLGDSDDQN